MDTSEAGKLRVRSIKFAVLLVGETASLIGDAFYLIALPWLVLTLTNDAALVGLTLAAAGVPRAVFMLIGGAIVDRFDPIRVMIASNIGRFVLVSLLAWLVATEQVQVWHVVLIALLFGLSDAFFAPAKTSAAPHLLVKKDLRAGNSLLEGSAQLSQLVGPAVAGIVIAFLANQFIGEEARLTALAWAFAFDAATFVLAIVALCTLLGVQRPERSATDMKLIKSLQAVFTYIGQRPDLRILLAVIVVMSGGFNGLIAVGIPVIVAEQLHGGTSAFGLIMSSIGLGSIAGMAIANALPRARQGLFGPVLMCVMALRGVGLLLMPLCTQLWGFLFVGFMMGATLGYASIVVLMWIQTETPSPLIGRMMSVLMFSVVGLAPVFAAAAGLAAKTNLDMTFLVTGIALVIVPLAAATAPPVRRMTQAIAQ